MTQFAVREANVRDVAKIHALFCETEILHRQAHPEIFRPPREETLILEYLKNSILDPGAAIFVAENGEETLGAIHCRIQSATENPVLVPRKFALVENINVAKDFQHTGVGKALMKRVEQWAAALGAGSIELTVWEFNQTAKDFYRRLGFRVLHQRMAKEL